MVHRHLFKNRAICAPAAMIAMFVISGAAHGGGVLYVDDDAPPGGDGTSWNIAYRFLQDGLTDACGGGITEIRVGQGIYYPDRDEANPDGTGDREATFQLCNGVALMGGYAGFGAKDPDARNIELYETTLTGDLLDNDGPDFANNDENSYHVVIGSGTDETAELDGFSVTAGNGNAPFPDDRGAGMRNLTGSPTVTNCTFRANSATFAGGMGNSTSSSPVITGCTFSGNRATNDAGGMGNIFDSNPIVTNCTFSGNMAADAGGGMGNGVGSNSPIVTNCTFSGNTAAFGGGMVNFDNSNPTVTDCTFDSNIAQLLGGGMANDFSSPTVTNCTFSANTAGDGGGGMINRLGSNPSVTDCTFSGNMAAGGRPGSGGGGVVTGLDSFPTITNCTFSGNTAPAGGGIYTTDIFGGHSETTVVNTIVWSNNPDGISDAAGAMTTVNYSDVQGGWFGAGANNIDADPLFVAPGSGDYRLSSGSPAIDAGNNWGVPVDVNDYDEDGTTCELFPVDLDGSPRFNADEADFDPGCGVPVVVDMGAYEYQFDPADQVTFADLNGDGSVGVKDLLFLLGAWGPCGKGCCLADFDGSGDVGVKDLLSLLGAWGPCP